MQVDGCFGDHWPQANQSWILFRQGLDECAKRGGRKIVLSVESCDDPAGCGEWIGGLANTWRTGGDIQATFASVLANLEATNRMATWQGPTGGPLGGGRFNDADMLQVGAFRKPAPAHTGIHNCAQQSHHPSQPRGRSASSLLLIRSRSSPSLPPKSQVGGLIYPVRRLCYCVGREHWAEPNRANCAFFPLEPGRVATPHWHRSHATVRGHPCYLGQQRGECSAWCAPLAFKPLTRRPLVR